MGLDHSRLVGLKKSGANWTAQCPACVLSGADLRGKNHLFIASDGRYGCAVDKSDYHSKQIWQLAGDGATGDISINIHQEPEQPKIEMEKTWDKSVLKRLVKDHSYWVGRGVPESVIEPLQGGIATEGQMKNRYVFPIFNDDDEIHGFAGRALSPKMEPRWKHLGKVGSWFWADSEEIRANRRAILVEGAGCKLSLTVRGHTEAIPLWGINMSQVVLGKLIELDPLEIIVALNNDTKSHSAGQRASAKIKDTLDKFFLPSVTRVILPPVKDFGDIKTEEQWLIWENQVNRLDGDNNSGTIP